MNRFKEGTVIIGRGIDLIAEEILKLEIELIELGRFEETDQLEYNSSKDLIVKYEPILELMDRLSQAQSLGHSSNPPSQNPSSTPTIFSSSQCSVGQPSRAAYKDYGNEFDDIKPREKRFPLETIDKKLLLYDGRFLNLTAYDPQT